MVLFNNALNNGGTVNDTWVAGNDSNVTSYETVNNLGTLDTSGFILGCLNFKTPGNFPQVVIGGGRGDKVNEDDWEMQLYKMEFFNRNLTSSEYKEWYTKNN